MRVSLKFALILASTVTAVEAQTFLLSATDARPGAEYFVSWPSGSRTQVAVAGTLRMPLPARTLISVSIRVPGSTPTIDCWQSADANVTVSTVASIRTACPGGVPPPTTTPTARGPLQAVSAPIVVLAAPAIVAGSSRMRVSASSTSGIATGDWLVAARQAYQVKAVVSSTQIELFDPLVADESVAGSYVQRAVSVTATVVRWYAYHSDLDIGYVAIQPLVEWHVNGVTRAILGQPFAQGAYRALD